MYRIELSPGEETAFRTIEELAVAIRRKVVTSHSRIYHSATNRWLPIQFHPHYQIALSMPLTQADLVAGPPVAPLSELNLLGEPLPPQAPSSREAATQAALSAWPEPKPSVPLQPLTRMSPEEVIAPRPPARAPAPRPPVRAPAPQPPPRRPVEPRRAIVPIGTKNSHRAQGSRRRHKPQRSFRVALAGAVLIACAHLVASGASAPLPETITPRTVTAAMPGLESIPVPSFKSPDNPATVSDSSTRAAGAHPIPALPGAAAGDSAPVTEPEIEAAPDPDSIAGNGSMAAESLVPRVVDSSGKKALKGILRTISGSPAAKAKPPKR